MTSRDRPQHATVGLLVCCLVASRALASSFDVATLIGDTQRWFHSGCLYLVVGDDPSGRTRTRISDVSRRLSSRYIPSGQLTMHQAVHRLHLPCHANKPVFAVLGDLEDIALLTEVPSHATWLMFMEPNTPYERLFSKINIPLNCELLVIPGSGSEVVLTEVYRVHRKGKLLSQIFGRWSSQSGLKGPYTSMQVRRGNLHGFVLRAATLNSPPIIKLDRTDPQHPSMGGFFGEIWMLLEERMNFKSSYVLPMDNGYGSQLQNGSWNGMIATLLRQEADVAINEFTMTVGRASIIDYMRPIIFTSNSIFIRQPTSLSLRWDNFLAPFNSNLWLAAVVSILVIGHTLSLVYNTGRQYGNADAHGPHLYTHGTALFRVYGLFCQQGDDTTPRAFSSRTVHCLAGFLSVVIFAAYSGGLVSYLTAGVSTLPFNTFREMLEDGSYTLSVLAKSGKLNLLETSTDPLLKQLYTKLLLPHKDKLPTSVQDGLRQVCLKQRYSFMTAYDIALGLMVDLPCRIVAVKRAKFPDCSGMILPKHSPYKEFFNYNLQFLRTAGVLNRLRANAWTTSPPEMEASFSSVTLAAVIPIFMIIAGGLFICVLLLSCEIIVRDSYTRKRRRIHKHTFQKTRPTKVCH